MIPFIFLLHPRASVQDGNLLASGPEKNQADWLMPESATLADSIRCE
jgi:hypothetical protein